MLSFMTTQTPRNGGKRQFPKRKNTKNGEWMLNVHEAISIHLFISAFMREMTRLADHQQERIMEGKQKLIKRIKAEESGYFYTK